MMATLPSSTKPDRDESRQTMALADALETQIVTAPTTADKLMDAAVAELRAHQSTRMLGCRHRSLSPELM
jgi:hypothetical protein